jgi:predicted P-loop ATPase
MEIEWEINKRNELADPEFCLSIIPVSSAKIPFSAWGKYQNETAPVSNWLQHFRNQGTVGVITGKVSENLVCIDIDLKNDPRKSIYDELVRALPFELIKKPIIQTTPNGGFHWIYRCQESGNEPSQKLALNTDGAVILETRGEGGYFCTSLVNNQITQGTFELSNLNVEIPVLAKVEHELILETARRLTRYFPRASDKKDKRFEYNDPAINEFNQNFNIVEIFEKHNWSIFYQDEEKVYLKRDGSLAAYSGYYFKKDKVFFCFSTSTDFHPQKPYNHFQVLQVLEGRNDYKTTLKLIQDLGFQSTNSVNDKVTSDDIAEYLNGLGVRYDSFIQDITINGGIIEERDYNTLFINLKKHFGKEISRQKFEEIIKSNYIQAINPIQDFIEANKSRKPSGTFEKWLDCLELKNKSVDKNTVLLFLKKWYVGLIAQALNGEFPNEFFLTLLSVNQGIGKTTWLRKYTLPSELHSYRKEHSLSFDDDFKVLMSQALLIIDDEMDGRSYEADKTFKTILSTKELTTRRKYDRRISTIKRRASFAGSGNNLSIVREQQNRRIIPIEIERIYFEKLAEVNLVDLFMEAYHLYESGFQYSYQSSDRKLLDHLFADYIQKSDVDVLLDEYVQKPVTIGDVFHITAMDIVLSLAAKFPLFQKRINLPTVGKMMLERGYESSRKGKSRITCYAISKHSRILMALEENQQSWRLNSIENQAINNEIK